MEPGKAGARTGTAGRAAIRLIVRWIAGAAVGVGGAWTAGCAVLEIVVGGKAVAGRVAGIAWTASGGVDVEGADAGGAGRAVGTDIAASEASYWSIVASHCCSNADRDALNCVL